MPQIPVPRLLNAVIRLTALNPIAIRLVGAASRKQRDYFIRTGFVTLLAVTLLMGLFGVMATGRLSLRDLAAGSAQIFVYLSNTELILICLLTPIFMAGAIAKEAQPRTWDIMLTTPLSALQIVLGNLLGRLFFVATLLLGALPLMAITQFFGGVRGNTILLTQLIAFCLALLIGSIAIATSVTRTAGRKAVITFFVFTACYLVVTWAVDQSLRVPVSPGSVSTWTTLLTPFNPLLVLEALLSPTMYVIPETSTSPWPMGYAMTDPIAAWCWFTVILSVVIVMWGSMQVRKLGDRSKQKSVLLFQSTANLQSPKAVTGNPIAWRERVTRHRNISSLFGRWGFAAIGLLAIIVTTTLFATGYWNADLYRAVVVGIIVTEIIIVALGAIYVAASSITREREDGSLDLLLTTSMTPKLYLSGKVHGIVIHLLPMVATPCVTMITVGIVAFTGGVSSAVSDIPVGMQEGDMVVPLAMLGPSLLLPVVLVPFIAFCITLGLQWSLRSKGSVRAVAGTLMMVLAISFGLGVCMTPAGSMGVGGAFFASFSPISYLFASTYAVEFLPSLVGSGLAQTSISLVICAPIAGTIWILASWGLLRSIAASFVMTVRRLAGTN